MGFQRGKCNFKGCRYKHEIAILEPNIDVQADCGMVQVNNVGKTSANQPYLVDKILIDVYIIQTEISCTISSIKLFLFLRLKSY